MARRGFLGRVWDAVKRIITPPQEPPRREPPPGPPVPPPEGPGGAPPKFSDEYEIWRDITVDRDRQNPELFAEWRELYENATAPLMMNATEDLIYWRQFLRAYYLTLGERNSLSRRQFHMNIGVRQRDWEMDWEEWRELKRGTP